MQLAHTKRRTARIEIIPLIDVVFFLLVFFMISTLSMSINRSLPVNLPKAATAQKEASESMQVTMTSGGELFLNKEAITLQDLGSRLHDGLAKQPDLLVILHADDESRHGALVHVMDTVRLAGVSRLAIAVKPERSSQP